MTQVAVVWNEAVGGGEWRKESGVSNCFGRMPFVRMVTTSIFFENEFMGKKSF